MKYVKLAAILGLLASPAQAVTFNIDFGSSGGATGTVSFDDLGRTGTFDFFALTNRTFTATFGAVTYTLADATTTAVTQVLITGLSGSRSLVFSGDGNGPQTGSIEFLAPGGGRLLTFGPTGFEGLYAETNVTSVPLPYTATEAAAAVPLPASALLLLASLAGLGIAARRRA
ncbi:VPLPA-CTERM sorting domain-containing protein [Jannaschia seohaensis]|uniref:Putative secreted protein n=1 Tax=Jannaschia seohaensis TaxID=475081 RepID=A0A2Y9B0J8_9RHOB|nr:VPLPA-CTERM sorting domain-containing protein [Jannaschia seohaensis]PWJ15067.1 putative secreted protein [Jannaschia seohaensis]SSA49916.1 VPLPA-CTERM protein sorting domain-containing protein [Jannaschia seohaensis]